MSLDQSTLKVVSGSDPIDPIRYRSLAYPEALKAVEQARNKTFYLHVGTLIRVTRNDKPRDDTASACIRVTKRIAYDFLEDIKTYLDTPDGRIKIAESNRCMFIGGTP
jgi:hypothetical protein